VLDCIVTAPVDVTFDLLHRRGTDDSSVVTWTMHFNPLPTSFDAQKYEVDLSGNAIDYQPADKLVFKFTGTDSTVMEAWIPNGDGDMANGRIPNITLPK
jgi:hypothetical protein